jgi:NADH-quinone oxidoreductase subunit N
MEVTAFLSVASKGAALVLMLRVAMNVADAYNFGGTSGEFMTAAAVLAIVLGSLGALSTFVGNTAAYVQNNIKRLLAYSSIAHAGYMLCAISLMLKAGVTTDPASIAGRTVLYYLAVYLFMNLGAFTVAGLVLKQTGVETLDGYAGLGRRNPVLAVCMALFMFSFVGLPPLAGFTAKFNILVALLQSGGWWWALVLVIAVNTVLSLYFYMRVVRSMFLINSDQPAFAGNPLGVAMALMCAIMLLVMFVASNPLTKLTENYGRLQLSGNTSAQAAKVAMK